MENNTLIFFNTRLLLEQISELDPALARELALSAEDEEALQHKYKEYEKEIQNLQKLLDKQELLEKARYQANQAGELMVNQQMLGLMMHNAVIGDLDTVDRLVQKSIDKASSLIRFFEEKSQFLIGLGCKLDDYAHRHPASAWMVDQAKQKLTKTIGYSQQLIQESAPLLRTAMYSNFITRGMMWGFSAGGTTVVGAIPGALLGGVGGWATARAGELLYDYVHGQADEFNDYAQQIARDDFELLQNRRVAKAISGTAQLALDLLNVGRGKVKAGGVGGLSSKKYVRKPTNSSSASSRSIAEASQSQIAVERLVSQTKVGRISNGGNTLSSSGNISSNTRNKGKGKPPQTSSFNPNLQIPVPPRVQSRINLANGDTKKGWTHVVKEHYSSKGNKSEFIVNQQELRELLQSPAVVQSPIVRSFKQQGRPGEKDKLRFVREIDIGKVVGTDKFSNHKPTTIFTVMTDEKGNLITTTPGIMR